MLGFGSSGDISITVVQYVCSMIFDIFKRTVDVVGSSILLILFSPVIVLSAILIKITSQGPIFADTPERVGMNGKPFYPYKFRSMIANAYNLLHTDPKLKKALDEQQKSGNYKIKNDPRVTPFGKIIRKHSIDEIPQLLNVLKGEMSIVGPRPYYEDELEKQMKIYPDKRPLLNDLLSVRPGITGYWQVSGRSSVTFDKRIEMDVYYARKRSIWFDIMILLKTPWEMVSGKNTA